MVRTYLWAATSRLSVDAAGPIWRLTSKETRRLRSRLRARAAGSLLIPVLSRLRSLTTSVPDNTVRSPTTLCPSPGRQRRARRSDQLVNAGHAHEPDGQYFVQRPTPAQPREIGRASCRERAKTSHDA